MFSGSNQTPSSRSSCDATASCRAEATSCVTYTASCYLAGSPGNCARWNACQLPDSIFILWSALGCAEERRGRFYRLQVGPCKSGQCRVWYFGG